MKKFLLLFVVLCLLFSAMAVAADTCTTPEEPKGPFKVTYEANNCLAAVPTDCSEYMAGSEVTVLFEPVKYKDNLLFYGWDWNNDGIPDFGYEYNTFEMPEKDVTLKAICISPWATNNPAPAPAPAPIPFCPCFWCCF